MRSVLRIAGAPIGASAVRNSSRVSTLAQGAVRPPISPTNAFSSARSCAMPSAAGAGCTGTLPARYTTGASAMFSNS